MCRELNVFILLLLIYFWSAAFVCKDGFLNVNGIVSTVETITLEMNNLDENRLKRMRQIYRNILHYEILTRYRYLR